MNSDTFTHATDTFTHMTGALISYGINAQIGAHPRDFKLHMISSIVGKYEFLGIGNTTLSRHKPQFVPIYASILFCDLFTSEEKQDQILQLHKASGVYVTAQNTDLNGKFIPHFHGINNDHYVYDIISQEWCCLNE